MASANFAQALDVALRHEGGYVDHHADPGGATNLGITRATLAEWRGRAVSKAEVRALTKAEAARIYRGLYWDEIAGDALPPGVDLVVFDYCINSGPARAARTLQTLLGIAADGRIGRTTISACCERDPSALIAAYCKKRLGFLQSLKTFSVFGRGWRRRVHETRTIALAMVAKQPPAPDLSPTSKEYIHELG